MLILTRRVGETLMIGETVILTVLSVKGRQIRIGIDAPKNVTVHRKGIPMLRRPRRKTVERADLRR